MEVDCNKGFCRTHNKLLTNLLRFFTSLNLFKCHGVGEFLETLLGRARIIVFLHFD
jgi:hypothetical protein